MAKQQQLAQDLSTRQPPCLLQLLPLLTLPFLPNQHCPLDRQQQQQQLLQRLGLLQPARLVVISVRLSLC
jgi:hypothetical protein